jgi:hypothetical protein
VADWVYIFKEAVLHTLHNIDVRYLADLSAAERSLCWTLFLIFQIVNGYAVYHSLISVAVYTFVMALHTVIFLALFLPTQRSFLVSLVLVLITLMVIAFPVYYWIKQCVGESSVATTRIVNFLQENPELNTMLDKYQHTQLYTKTVR